jgi:hypothetical protein
MRSKVSSSKLFDDGFRLNLLLEVYTKCNQANFIVVPIVPLLPQFHVKLKSKLLIF